MIYRTISGEDRATAVRERLKVVETQHFTLGLRLGTSLPGTDPEEDGIYYDQLERHIGDLQAQLTELEGSTHG